MVFVPNGQKNTTFLGGSSGHILSDYLLIKCTILIMLSTAEII
jgi:hypothetical protein